MRLTPLWVAATTLATTTLVVTAPGCFGPSLQLGQECSVEGACPGDLECINNVCCEKGTSCSALDDDAGPIDAGPDADPRAFTDHLTPFSCDADTLYLLNFDDVPFANGVGGCMGVDVVARMESKTTTSVASAFVSAVALHPNDTDNRTKFVQGQSDQLIPGDAYTAEAWFDVERPTGSGTDVAVIASALRVAASPSSTVLGGSFLVGLRPDGRLFIELYSSDCLTQDARSFSSQGVVPTGEMTHFRLAVSQTAVRLYLNAILDTEVELAGSPVCTDPTRAAIRVGGVDRTFAEQEFDFRKAASGRVDELRYSRVAR